jgi:hypothetical protein
LSTPPPLSPQIKQESQDVSSAGPPTLSPATSRGPCTQVQANNLQHTSVTQDPLSLPDPLSDTIFVNSDVGNSYLAEEPVAADLESTSDEDYVGYVDFGLSLILPTFNSIVL